jgi:hypothetical protein
MKKNHALTLALIFLVGICPLAQKPENLVGTWVGDATIDGMDANELTLVLEHKEGKFSGTMTGQYGTLNDSPVENAKLEKDIFSFSVMAEGPQGQIAVNFKMKVSGTSMEGDLDIPDMGLSGAWSAKKQ